MEKILAAIGPKVVLSILGMVIRPLLPWLKEQAAISSTPIDNWAADFLEMLFGVKGEE